MSIPNPCKEHLIPLNKRTKKAQRKIQSMGGKVSAENIRRTKELVKVSEYLHQVIDIQKDNVRVSLNKVIKDGGQPLLSLLKLVVEQTEGTKSNITHILPEIKVAKEQDKLALETDYAISQ